MITETTMDRDGFLADEVSAIRQAVTQVRAEYRALLREINQHAVNTQHSIVILKEPQKMLGAVLFGRLVMSIQASVILLEHGLETQARAVLRQALEALFGLGAVGRDPAIFDRLLETHERERLRTFKYANHWASPEARKALIEIEPPDASENPRSLSTFELAQKAGMEAEYRSLYASLSWSVHLTAHDLAQHFVAHEHGEVTELQMNPVVEGQGFCWDVACAVLPMGLHSLGKMFRKMERAKTDRLESQLNELRVGKPDLQ